MTTTKTESYHELTERHQKEWATLPMFYAFSEKQFDEGCDKVGASKDNKVVGIGAGGYILKKDLPMLQEMYERHTQELAQLMSDEKRFKGAVKYELGNHEYQITGEAQDTIEALGLEHMTPAQREWFKAAESEFMTMAIEKDWF